jgi:glycosyltransferase involved in cell wall biosynthesis
VADPRDNTAAAVEACRLAGVELVVVGEAGIGRVSDEKLVDLYQRAAAYLDPTLYEGFGYGVLEAMACGAPVVASNRSSIPEIVGDAGLLCDPDSPEELAAALRRVLDEPELAERMRQRALARSANFRWDDAAASLCAALEAALRRS